MVFLAGLGHTGWNLRFLASHFLERYRCVGITRRGIGESCQDDVDYTLGRSTLDLIEICDALAMERPLWVAHSYGCQELARLIDVAPEHVAGVVLIDGAYDHSGDAAFLRQFSPSGPPAPESADLASLDALSAYLARVFGVRMPPEDVRACHRWAEDGRCIGRNEHPEAAARLKDSLVAPSWEALRDLPTLALFAQTEAWPVYAPGVIELDAARQQAFATFFAAMVEMKEMQIGRFADLLPDAHIGRPAESGHMLHLSHEWLVVRWINEWLESHSAGTTP